MGYFQMSQIIVVQIAIQFIASLWINAAAADTLAVGELLSAYECGFEPVGDARMKFEILYYVIGILYLVFDLEIIFLFPLATLLFHVNSLFVMCIALLFQTIVTIGFIYEYQIGAQDLL